MSMFPYDINELADGPIRCMFAPITQPLPADLADIIETQDTYEPATGWLEFGATAGPFQAARSIATASYNIQQTTAAVLERITEVTRVVTVNVAEMRPDIIRMLEEGVLADTAAGAGANAYSKVTFGNISDLTTYRMAFLGRRAKAQGVVTEGTGGLQRGRLFAYVAYRTSLTADNLQLGFAEGDLANASVNFKLQPEPGEPEGEEHGYWIFEEPGVIAA